MKSKTQSVDKPVIFNFSGDKPLFCFSADRCGRKTPYKRKPLYKAVFKGARVVLAGVECSPKIRQIFGERNFRQKLVDFFDKRSLWHEVKDFFAFLAFLN